MGCGVAGRLHANGLALATHAWGDRAAPPVLLLHSLAAHSHWWDWVAQTLAARYHVVALDFRGHGGSARADRYDFEDYAADVVGALDALGWRAPLVVGHSLGGFVGALVAARWPARVSALVIADMLTFWTDEMARRGRAQAERPPAEFPSATAVADRFRLVPPETTAPAERLRHLGEAGAAEQAPGVWTATFDRRVFLHPPIDPWPFLGRIAAPTLVVRGAGSPLMSAEHAAAVAKAIPRAETAEIAGAFHHLIVDAPDAFAAAVARWDDRTS